MGDVHNEIFANSVLSNTGKWGLLLMKGSSFVLKSKYAFLFDIIKCPFPQGTEFSGKLPKSRLWSRAPVRALPFFLAPELPCTWPTCREGWAQSEQWLWQREGQPPHPLLSLSTPALSRFPYLLGQWRAGKPHDRQSTEPRMPVRAARPRPSRDSCD